MKALLYKEFKRTIHPLFLLICLLGAMVLIPNWPYSIAMMYFFICVPSLFAVCKEQNDMGFLEMMPVSRKDIVRSRMLAIVLLELLQIVVTMVFATINLRLYGNGSFWDPNLSFFGFAFLMYAIYNLIFFPLFYKTGYKTVIPVTLATMASILFAGVAESAVLLVPALAALLDGSDHMAQHLPAFAFGAFAFAGISYLAYKAAVKNFEKIDLC